MSLSKAYVPRHVGAAGKWIYEGYLRAWRKLGYETIHYDMVDDIDPDGDSYVMAIDADIRNKAHLHKLKNSRKTFLYVQPNEFPSPWGTHPNFLCHCPLENIESLNSMDNVHYWCFGNTDKHHTLWKKKVSYIPLAFDHIGYQPIKNKDLEYDVCYIGGWANNGFNEKGKIMMTHFNEIKNSKFKINAYIAINKNVSLQYEADLLFNSIISLNIHDKYQRVLGMDINERTFKSLGLTGFMISDHVDELKNLFPNVPTATNAKDYVKLITTYLGMAETNKDDLNQLKEARREQILNNHTYVHRVKQLLEL